MAGLRLALISDTHGFVDPHIVQIVETCDAVVHAGDIGNHAVLKLLRSRCPRVLAVRGNNDTPKGWSETNQSLLLRVPRALEISLPGGTLIVVHGDQVLPASTRHARLRRLYPQARAVVYGHTHRMRVDRRASPWVLNSGAAGRARTFGGPSCIVLDVNARVWQARKLRFAKNT
jgi:putative phosphoesterase